LCTAHWKTPILAAGILSEGNCRMFPASTRKLPIYFHYAWKEEDNITISLPAGFALDNADRPEPLKAGDVAEYEVLIGVTTKGDELHYKRSFKFNALIIPASSYTALKNLFDMIHERDNHTITLKQAAAAQ